MPDENGWIKRVRRVSIPGARAFYVGLVPGGGHCGHMNHGKPTTAYRCVSSRWFEVDRYANQQVST